MADEQDKAKSLGGTDVTATLGNGGGAVLPGVIPDLLPSVDQIGVINKLEMNNAVDAALSDCESVYNASLASIQTHIDNCIAECNVTTQTCISCILGQIERDLRIGQTVVARCWEKVNKSLADAVADNWKTAATAGMRPPTQAQFDAFLAGEPIPLDEPIASGGTSAPNPATPIIVPPEQVPLPPGATLPEGSVLPVRDTSTGQIICPDPGPPFRSPNSPTGYLQIQYQMVMDAQGNPLWCAPITHIASAPSAPSGGSTGSSTGSQPTGGTTTSGGTGGTGSSGTPTVPGGQGDASSTIGGVTPTCPDGFHLYQQPSFVAPNPGPGWISLGQSDDGQNLLWCVPDETPTEQTPPESESPNPGPLPPGLLACDPDNLSEAIQNIRGLDKGYKDPSDAIFTFFGVNPSDNSTDFSLINFIKHPQLPVASFVAGLMGSLQNVVNWVAEAPRNDGSTDNACNSVGYASTIVLGGFLRFVNQWTGIVPESLITAQKQYINYCFQYQLPSGGEALAARAAGYLTKEQSEFVWRCEGLCVPWQNKLLDASYNRIGIQDAYRLFKLGKLSDREFLQAWQRNRVNTDTDLALWNEALVQYPGVADIIRMMVRDIGDQSVISDLGLDAEFADKWQGFLKEWGEAQGISEDVALAFWMAHWQNPSPQQVYDWLHRLRTDDRDPDDPYKTLAVDKATAAKLLQIADYIPGLIDNYIATSYRPLTRVDIRRMYEVGTFDTLDPVRRGYRDLGYDARNAERLSDYTERISRPKRAALAGELPAKQVQTAYQNDLLTKDEARSLLDQSGLTVNQTETYLGAADNRRTIQSRKIRLDSLRKRYFVGEFAQDQAYQELVNIGLSQDASIRTVQLWLAERAAKAKQPTVAMLCNWYGKGLIDLAEYYRRVRNLNYSEVDAQRVVQMCQMGITEHKQKEYEKEQARIAKEEKARRRQELLDLKAARQAAREIKLRHRLEHKEVTKVTEKSTTLTVTDSVVDKPDDNITDTVQTVTVTTEQPPP